MEKLIIASMCESAGKTSMILGIAGALKKIGYMKPFGDRLFYRKKRLWDYDSASVANVLKLEKNPEDMSIGFEHSKLRYMYDQKTTKEKLLESVALMGEGMNAVFVEAGKNLGYGASVHLDAISMAKHIDGKLLVVIAGTEDTVADDIVFVERYVNTGDINFGGVIINKVRDPDDFRETHLKSITEMGVDVLGVVPYEIELTYSSVGYFADCLFAKVVAGEDGLSNTVKTIVVGGMSAGELLKDPMFRKEGKLIIASGERTDVLLAGLDSATAGIVLTSSILPERHIISKASERGIPLLLVRPNMYETAKQMDKMEPSLARDNPERVDLLQRLVKDNVDIDRIVQV
jgi:BioD-like phosphotransacetylase family protein